MSRSQALEVGSLTTLCDRKQMRDFRDSNTCSLSPTGLGIKELGDAIREYYWSESNPKQPGQPADDDNDLLFSETPPDNGPIVDDSFVELVWQWVSRNPEVTIECEHQGSSAADGDEPQTIEGSLLNKYGKQRLCTGEDRVWYAIAGHGIDYKRIPPLEFQALSAIAGQGHKGVLQPDVTKLTGQDKRSLPKRTDNLAKNGYIVKHNVIARGTKTSLLKLKKFAGDNEIPEDEKAAPGSVIIQYNLWFDEVMRMLKTNDSIMAFEDIRIGLGINGKRFETRALHRCVRRLANVGCLRKISARVEAPADEPDAEMKMVRSLHLLREPTDVDRVAFMRSDWQRSKLLDSAQVAQFANATATEEDQDDDEDLQDIVGLDGETENSKRLLHRSPPAWTPDIPFSNYLYNRIEVAGIAGTSSSELYEDAVGQFWKRAMDEMLAKLTDLWQFSQPPHLRHLSIVKDTGQRVKQPTFQYRTYDNFQKAVEIGDTFWEAVFGTEEKGKGKASKKKAENAASALPDLDEWGFPKISPKLFVGQSGAATLHECRRNANPTFQNASLLVTPGSLVRRGPSKTPISAPARLSKHLAANRTPTAKPKIAKPKESPISDAQPLPTPDLPQPRPGAKKSGKRTAEQADLEIDEAQDSSQQAPTIEPKAAITKGRKRKSVRVDDSVAMSSPVVTTKQAALNGSPVLKKRGRPTKAMLAEKERLEKEAEQARLAAKAQRQLDAENDSMYDGEEIFEPAPEVDVVTGISINPPGSLELKKRVLQSLGRPKKAKIAVFRSGRLREFSWYVREPIPTGPKTPKRTPKASKEQNQLRTPTSSTTPVEADKSAGPAQQTEPTNLGLSVASTTAPRAAANKSPAAASQLATTVKAGPVKRRLPWVTDKQPTPDEPTDADPRRNSPENGAPAPAAERLPSAALEPNTAAADDSPMDVNQALDDKPAAQPDHTPLPDLTVDDIADDDEPARQYRKAGVHKSNGTLHIKRRKVAMDIIQACGGVFPGRGEIWFPFATAWQRDYSQTPDRQTIDNVMKGLVSSGTLKKLTFYFKSRKGLTVERSIYAEPEIDPNSPRVKLLQKRIIESHPAMVLPEDVEIAPEYRERAARNPQATQNAKLARAAGEVPTPAPVTENVPEQLPPHYIRDEFPEDNTLTVRRTANGVGLGAIDAQLQSIKQSRKLANLKRGGRPRKTLPINPEWENGEDELTYEQTLLQGEQDPSSYGRIGGPKRSAARMRGFGPSGRRLPGRILGSKFTRKMPNTTRTATSQTKKSLPWDALGYVASQAAHSHVEPGSMPTTFKVMSIKKRVGRIQWQWIDPNLADWQTEPWGTDPDAEAGAENEAAFFGILLPDDANVVDGIGLSENVDVQLAPQTLNDIVNSHVLPSSPGTASDENEATKFFNEVERVEAWEKHIVKAKQALARGADRPFINYTTPADIPWSLDAEEQAETPRNRRSKRLRADDDEESPKPKLKKASSRAKPKVYAEDDPRKYKRRDRRAAAAFSEKDHDRLAKAVALISVVAGGLSYRRNWLIVAHAFGYEFESEFLRHRWDKVRDQRDALVKQMQAQIWEPFLDAYDRGVLPPIDFEDLEGTDWPALMEWLENEVLTTTMVDDTRPAAMINKVPHLPSTSAGLQSKYSITETTADLSVSRDEFFTTTIDKRRKDVITGYLNGLPLEDTQSSPVGAVVTNDLLRSWARAIVLTDDRSYNSDEAYHKIRMFGDKVLDSTIRDLCAEKILQVRKKGRRLPGRNLRLDDTAFLPVFKRWSDKQGAEHLFLARVAEKREEVLNVLQQQDYYELEYSAEDELYVVLTNMVGQGLLKVKSKLPERNDDFDAPFPKLTAWGYSGYNYNVRTFDKTRLRFSIVYEKTDKFVFDHGLRDDVPVPIHPPLYPNEEGYRIPLWVDIHEQLLPRMWEMAFRSVLNLVVFRPGINAADIEEAHKSKIWTWEIELLMKWMQETGMAERTGPGEEVDGLWKGGWKVGEWWYCAHSIVGSRQQAESGE